MAFGTASLTRFCSTLRSSASLIALAALASCASYPQLQTRPMLPTTAVQAGPAASASAPGVTTSDQAGAAAESRENIEVLSPVAPETAVTQTVAQATATPEQIAALLEPRDVQVTLPPQPLPQFIDTVFGEILRVPYSMGPGVAQRRDIVAMRNPQTLSNTRLFAMAQMALAQYGLAVVIDSGGVRISQDTVLSGQSPSFIRSRTSPETPAGSRPVMQFFAVSTVDVDALLPMLEQTYPNRGSVRFTAQAETNTLLISGSAREVAAAAAVVREIDQPLFANGQIARIEPIFLSPDQLAESLTRTLSTEGYRVGNPTENRRGAITILPLENANQVLVFANDTRLFDRALFWVRQLDRAAAIGNGEGVFVYTAQNTNAEDLAALVGQAASGDIAGGAPAPAAPEVAVRRTNGMRAGSGAPEAGPALSVGGMTVDTAGNRILFRGSASEFERLRALLIQLDTPPRQVLIEMTIAEVTLTDETRFGVEWFLDQTITDGTLSADTRGGSVREGGGLGVVASHVFSRGSVEAALNAFARNSNLNILSTPRVFTRSGREAEILIGTDVPIITSQRASNAQTGGDTDVLQTVQYRQTGVILNVRPVVYGDDRIDISLYQEVSNQRPNTAAAINSPLILNRSVATQISLQEGMTAVIGGLIQDNYSREQRGVPGLKDIPIIGSAFRSEEVTGDKVELVILVTPYIVRDSEDVGAITESVTGSLNRTLRRRGSQVYTLYPWRAPFEPVRTHGSLRDALTRPATPPQQPAAEQPAATSPAEAQQPASEPAQAPDTATPDAHAPPPGAPASAEGPRSLTPEPTPENQSERTAPQP